MKPGIFQKNKLVFTIVIIFFIFSLGASMIIKTYEIAHCDEINSLNAEIEVEASEKKYIGLDINKENVTFGKVSQGAIVEKQVHSNYAKEAKVSVSFEGDEEFKKWMMINPNHFDVIPNEKQNISLVAYVSNEAKVGKYKGKIFFCYNNKGWFSRLLGK